MNFVPLDDRILIEPIEEKEKTGILAIPDAVREKPLSGKVIAIGNDVADGATIPLYKLVEIGDEIVFGKYGGHELKLDGVKYMIVSRPDILGIIKK